MRDLIDLFALGMKRPIVPLIPMGDVVLNLGAGRQEIFGAATLDYPEWDASYMPIPWVDDSVDTILAFHFLEHLRGARVIEMLREIERVLRPGGTAMIVVPHRLSQMAYHDLDHQSFFCEETWRILFTTTYYAKNREVPWRLHVGTNVIMGLVERNLALLTQLEKR